MKLLVFRRNLHVYYKHQPSRALHPTTSQFSPLHTVTFCFFKTGIRNVALSKCDRDTAWSVLFFISWRPELLPSSAGIRPDFWRRPVVICHRLTWTRYAADTDSAREITLGYMYCRTTLMRYPEVGPVQLSVLLNSGILSYSVFL